MKGPEAQFMMGGEGETHDDSIELENKVHLNSNDEQFVLNEREQEIHEIIQKSIEKYKNGKRDLDEFKNLVREIESNSRENYPLQDFAWSQDQVDLVVGELNNLTVDNSDYSTKLIFDVKSILIQGAGISDSSHTSVSDLFARSFVNLVKDENVNISRKFEEMVGYMGQDIQMFGSKERYAMVYAMLDNPGKIGEDVRYNFIGGMVLYGSFHDYATYYESGTLDEKIKILEVIRFLREVGDDIYNGSSERIHAIIKELEKNENNYLLEYQLQCINGKDRYNWDIFRRFNDLSDKNINPLYYDKIKNDYSRESMRQKTCFSSISDNYGVIYDSSGKIDSFFIANDQNTGEPRRISLKKILEIEGFDTENVEELEKNLTTYKVLLEPIFRKKIEDDFHIKLKEFSVRTQMQFLNFLSKSAVDKDDVKLLQSFLSKYQKNGLRSFLSLEHGGQEMGEKILKIGEKYDQKTAEVIFAKYADMVDSVGVNIEFIKKIYNNIFPDVEIESEVIMENILHSAKTLLKNAADEIIENDKKGGSIEVMIKELETEEKAKRRGISKVVELFEKLQNISGEAIRELATNNIDTYEHYEFDDNNVFDSNIHTQSEFNTDIINPQKIQEIIRKIESAIQKEIGMRDKHLAMDVGDRVMHFDTVQMSIIRDFEKNIHEKKLLIKKLNKIGEIQDQIKSLLNSLVYEMEMSDKTSHLFGGVVEKYQEILDLTAETAKRRLKTVSGEENKLTEEQVDGVVDALLERADEMFDLLINSIDDKDKETQLEEEIESIDARVLLLEQIIKRSDRSIVAKLDLREISDIERYVDLKANDLAKMPELLEKMKSIVKSNFPEGDEDIFVQDCLGENNNGLTVTMAKSEILSFFMKKKLKKNLSYLDWFSANQDAPIKGLGEATVLLGFNQAMRKNEAYYAVAKPYIKSFGTLIEQLGFVGFGDMTRDGEYKHHYGRARRLPHDANYASKNFSYEQDTHFSEEIKKICQEEHKIQTVRFENQNYQVCRVSFFGMDHQKDLDKNDDDGWIYQEIERQSQKGNILTRYISASQDKANATYYAVFEQDKSTLEERKDLEYYLAASRLRHSDSKNNENS